MQFLSTIRAHRRLTLLLAALVVTHAAMLAAFAYAVVRYQQFWAVAGILWLPLMMPSLVWTSGFLKQFLESRSVDLLGQSGIEAEAVADTSERRQLTNVVEEMAVATGGGQPRAVVFRSGSANAFIFDAGEVVSEGGEMTGPRTRTVVFTSGMLSHLNRHELQAVAAHLYTHLRDFDGMFAMMAGAMFLADFLFADLFLLLTVVNWNFGGSGDFSTGPLVVILALGMLYGPIAGSLFAYAAVLRRVRFLDDLRSLTITKDPQSLIGALEKISSLDETLEASYSLTTAHFYFDAVRDPSRRFPWQRIATHPRPQARVKALKAAC